jgi:hypothetical protein
MFIKILKKIILTIIALAMLIYSLASWRYYGDVYRLRVELFQSEVNYQEDVYNARWAMSIGVNTIETNQVEMKQLYFYDIPWRLYTHGEVHPSEVLISRIVNIIKQKKLAPSAKESSYKLTQPLWISKHLTIQEVINYDLNSAFYGNYEGISAASLGYFGKGVEGLNLYEILMLEAMNHAPSYFDPQRHPDRLLKRVNDFIAQLKKIFPKKYLSVECITKLPTLASPPQ